MMLHWRTATGIFANRINCQLVYPWLIGYVLLRRWKATAADPQCGSWWGRPPRRGTSGTGPPSPWPPPTRSNSSSRQTGPSKTKDNAYIDGKLVLYIVTSIFYHKTSPKSTKSCTHLNCKSISFYFGKTKINAQCITVYFGSTIDSDKSFPVRIKTIFPTAPFYMVIYNTLRVCEVKKAIW